MENSFVIIRTEQDKHYFLERKDFESYARCVRMLSFLRRQFSVINGRAPVGAAVEQVMELAKKDGADPFSDEYKLLRERLFELICKGANFREIADVLRISDDRKKNLNRKRMARYLHNHLRKHLREFAIPVGKNFPSSTAEI